MAHLTADGIYVAGYKIDAQGINYPRLVYVSGDLRSTKSWGFAESIAQVFQFRGAAHVLDTTGGVFTLEGDTCKSAGFRVPPHSWMLARGETLIACRPTPWQRESRDKAGCTSVTQGWSTPVRWRARKPVLCGDDILVLDDQGDKPVLFRIRVQDGVVRKQGGVVQVGDSLCPQSD